MPITAKDIRELQREADIQVKKNEVAHEMMALVYRYIDRMEDPIVDLNYLYDLVRSFSKEANPIFERDLMLNILNSNREGE